MRERVCLDLRLYAVDFLIEEQLRAGQVGKVHHHQEILHIRVEHVLELLRLDLGDAGDQVQQETPDHRVSRNLARNDVVDVLDDDGRASGGGQTAWTPTAWACTYPAAAPQFQSALGHSW